MSITRLGQNRICLVAGAAAKDHVLLKVNGDKIVSVNHISIYNDHAAQTITFYLGLRRAGKFHRSHYKATLAAKTIEPCCFPIYMHAGDELLMNVIASGANTPFEVFFQLLDVV